MRVILGDESWHWDPDEITVDEALLIKKHTGLSWGPFRIGLMQSDPEAVRALIWFLRQRETPGLELSWVKGFRMNDVTVEPDSPEVEQTDPPTKAAAPKTGARRARPTSKTSKAS